MVNLGIVSSRVVEDDGKKYVAYMLQVKQESEDSDCVNVERRYTHFLDLYNGLKKEHPALLQTITFPKKTVVGNFDQSLISSRTVGFDALLNLMMNESRLRDTSAAIAFFQDPELLQAKKLIDIDSFIDALNILETSFKLLNKVYTDRSRVVLSTLCRIVACADGSSVLAGPVERWAQLALRRYEGVSDSDLLLMYIPLLYSCLSIWETLGRDRTKLMEEINDLKKRGMKVDRESVPSLMAAVDGLTADY